MPQRPDDLARIIREIATKQAKNRGKSINADALTRISFIPAEYAKQEIIQVELDKLEEMISDVIEIAAKLSSAPEITKPDIEQALDKVDCHYLWFC